MLAVEQAARRLDPLDVGARQDVVLHPDHEGVENARHEGEGDEIVDRLQRLGHRRKGPLVHERQQHPPADRRIGAGEGEDEEGDRGQPMAESLIAAEARDRPAGKALGQTQPPPDQICLLYTSRCV